MDTLRGQFGTVDHDEGYDYAPAEEDTGREPPPSPIGQDERRMQVRAYNHWAGLLGEGNFPSIEDLAPETLPDFGPYSVLLDFTNGIEDPAVRYLGAMLATECDAPAGITRLSDVPARSLLTRITDHYMQILANQAPIGFEAEFVNQRGATIMYRGILLPYSSDDDTIDFIYGVINWKEIADQLTSDELLLEIDQALETDAARTPDPVTDWADGPGASPAPAIARAPIDLSRSHDPLPLPAFGSDEAPEDDEDDDETLELEDYEDSAGDLYEAIEAVDDEPAGTRFASLLGLGGAKVGRTPIDLGEAGIPGPDEEWGEDEGDEDYADQDAALAAWQTPRVPLQPTFDPGRPMDIEPVDLAPVESEPVAYHQPLYAVPASAEPATDAAEFSTDSDDAQLGLHDCLAAARELALAARSCEDRSRSALYAAVGRAYDFSLAAQAEPEEFADLIADSGLTVQERAPMTPVVKLVFGADYDKTRLTEYAAVLSHAHRMGVERGTLAGLLSEAEGGLKGIVQAERDYRRADGGEAAVRETPREALARKLRAIAPLGFEDIAGEGEEFALVMIRRTGAEIVVLGEIADVALVEKAAKKLVA